MCTENLEIVDQKILETIQDVQLRFPLSSFEDAWKYYNLGEYGIAGEILINVYFIAKISRPTKLNEAIELMGLNADEIISSMTPELKNSISNFLIELSNK